ncbi:arylamine N-acetyltransferase family protein [Streptomyces lavendofoliae]|uniref:arylamine N-acetyltransferase family protein n=1 Tax=Streptomyces lavendofoliae TaxID=67314 RepID=UPI00300F36B1
MIEHDVRRYLDRLEADHTGRPGVVGLRALHRAHVERVPYETLDFQLRRPTTSDPEYSVARVLSGRGGYCFHLNGAFGTLLSALGYDVRWHRGGVQLDRDTPAPGANANHLTLTVRCEGEDWLVDVGMGDALYEPVPLRAGTYHQGPFTYRLSPSVAEPGGWRLDHDTHGKFAGMDFSPAAAAPRDFAGMHRLMSVSPASVFVRIASVYRRDADGVDRLCGCVLSRVDATGRRTVRELTTAEEWFGTVRELFGLSLDDLGTHDRARLWEWLMRSHAARQAAVEAAARRVPAHVA